MILVLLVLTLMVVSSVLVVAAGMLSSRLSRHEGLVETFEGIDSAETDMYPQTID